MTDPTRQAALAERLLWLADHVQASHEWLWEGAQMWPESANQPAHDRSTCCEEDHFGCQIVGLVEGARVLAAHETAHPPVTPEEATLRWLEDRHRAAEARCSALTQQVDELKRRAESEQLHRVEAESWTVMAACIKRQREALDAAEARHSALQHERDRETELRRKAEAHAQTLVAALHEKPYADEYDDLGRDLKAVEAERDQLRTVLAETAVKHLDRAERAEAERDRLRTALETLTRQWRDNVLAIGPRLEGAAFEQCANDLEVALASPRVPASEVKP